MKLILVCKKNIASVNIGKQLDKSLKILELDCNVLDFDKYEKEIRKHDPELVIVASSHKSEAGVNTLTCHPTGNWSDNKLGGEKEKLSIAPALYLREALLELENQKKKLNLENYEVAEEASHHGPTITIPIIFIEVGSSEKQWRDLEACKAAAETIRKLIKFEPKKVPTAIGIGGTHYCSVFTKVMIKSEIAIGHVCPKYALESLDANMLRQAIEKTSPKPDFVLLDWKGLGEEKSRIIELLNSLNIKYKKAQDLLKE